MATVPDPRTWSVGEVLTATLLNAQVRDPLDFLLGPPYAEVAHSANQSIPNNTDTALNWNSEFADTDGGHDTVTNNTRYTAQTSGIFLCQAHAAFAGNATGKRDIMFRRNDGIVYGRNGMMPNSAANAYISTAAYVPMTAGMYVEAMVYQNSGGSLNIDQSLGSGQRMFIQWMRSVP